MLLKRAIFILAAGMLFSVPIGCSKKVVKTDVKPVVEQKPVEPVQQPEEVTFKPTDMDDEMRAVLVPVYFDYDKYTLRSDAIQVVEKAAGFLDRYKQVRIMLEGNTDERGTDEYNMGLGENRARAVKKYLAGFGLPDNRFEIVSYGKTRPVDPNCTTEQCHGLNRRVEWKVLAR